MLKNKKTFGEILPHEDKRIILCYIWYEMLFSPNCLAYIYDRKQAKRLFKVIKDIFGDEEFLDFRIY